MPHLRRKRLIGTPLWWVHKSLTIAQLQMTNGSSSSAYRGTRQILLLKVIACCAETGHFDKIVLCSKKVGYRSDYVALLQHIMRTNPEKGVAFAMHLVNDETGPLVDVERVRYVTVIRYLFPC
jgi:hypothetical protein